MAASGTSFPWSKEGVARIFLEMIYHHWGLMMVSGMTRLRTGYVGGIDGVKVPVTGWTINRLDGYCAVFAEDLSDLEKSVIRITKSASQ